MHKKKYYVSCVVVVGVAASVVVVESIEKGRKKWATQVRYCMSAEPIVVYDSFSCMNVCTHTCTHSSHIHRCTRSYIRINIENNTSIIQHTHTHTHTRIWLALTYMHAIRTHLCSLQLSRSQLWNEKSINYQRSFFCYFFFFVIIIVVAVVFFFFFCKISRAVCTFLAMYFHAAQHSNSMVRLNN